MLIEWACEKVRRSAALPDGELFELVKQRLAAGVSSGFGQIAWAAHQSDRRDLACRFLAMERRVQDRVPLYLMMEQEATALKEASDAHDADLMLFAALQIWIRCGFWRRVVTSRWKNGAIPNDRFASLITGFPEIGDILEEYLEIRGDDVESLLRAEGRSAWRDCVTEQNRSSLRTSRVSGVSRWKRRGSAIGVSEADPIGAHRGSVSA